VALRLGRWIHDLIASTGPFLFTCLLLLLTTMMMMMMMMMMSD